MKGVIRKLLFMVLAATIVLGNSPAFSDEIGELKKMIVEMKKDYDRKIEDLQGEVTRLKDKLAIREEVEMESEGRFGVEYVGRYNGPFEKGGLIVRENSGFGNVSVGGYMDHEYENFQNRTSTFDQHRWILNVGAELGERLRFYSEYEIEHGGPDAPQGGGKLT